MSPPIMAQGPKPPILSGHRAAPSLRPVRNPACGPSPRQPRAKGLTAADGREEVLTTADFRLLTALLARPRFVLSRDQLLDITSGRSAHVFGRTIDNQISRLRRKIERDLSTPEITVTVRGGGYICKICPSGAPQTSRR